MTAGAARAATRVAPAAHRASLALTVASSHGYPFGRFAHNDPGLIFLDFFVPSRPTRLPWI